VQYKLIAVKAVYGLGTDFQRAGEELSQQVNEALAAGWKPQGGVMVGKTQSTREPYLFQAIVSD
jgi:Domain of unknown function (DUF1737)